MESARVVVEPYKKHDGIYMLFDGDKNLLCTKSIVPDDEIVDNKTTYSVPNEDGTKYVYRVWDPSTSDLAAAILKGGMDNIWIVPGAKVFYLGPQSVTTVSHVSDIVGTSGLVCVLDNDLDPELYIIASKRPNVALILVPDQMFLHPLQHPLQVDVVLSELPRPFKNEILALFASNNLKDGGHFVVSLQENPKNKLIEALIPKHLKGIIDCDIDRPEHAPGIGIQFQCLLKDGLKPFQHACLRREHYYFVGDYSRARKPEEPSYFVGDYSGAQEPDSPEPDSY